MFRFRTLALAALPLIGLALPATAQASWYYHRPVVVVRPAPVIVVPAPVVTVAATPVVTAPATVVAPVPVVTVAPEVIVRPPIVIAHRV